MDRSILEIAEAMQARCLGDGALRVRALAEPQAAGAHDLALAMSPRFADALAAGRARAAVVWDGADWEVLGLKAAIVVGRPRLAMAQLTAMMQVSAPHTGIHDTAIIDPSAKIGAGVQIGPFCVIGADAEIGAGCMIGAHVTLADTVQIGAGVALADGVRIGRAVTIGANAVLHPNVVIGADGFSFVTQDPGLPEVGRRTLGKTPFAAANDPVQHKIHSLGGVVIGDDVEVGANSTIDAGTIRPTQVGRGTKIDNLVQVGHNVIVGQDCLLCAQTAVAGSAVIGDRCILGGKSGVADNITVGSDTLLGGGAIVLGSVPAGSFMMGYPAKQMLAHRAEQRALRNLASPPKGDT